MVDWKVCCSVESKVSSTAAHWADKTAGWMVDSRVCGRAVPKAVMLAVMKDQLSVD